MNVSIYILSQNLTIHYHDRNALINKWRNFYTQINQLDVL